MDPTTAVPSPAATPVAAAGRRGTASQFRRLSIEIAVSDLIAILAAFLIAYFIRFGFAKGKFDFLAVMIVAPPVFVVIFASFRLYAVHRLTPAEEYRRIVYAVTVGITGVTATSFWTKAQFSRIWVGLSWVLCLALISIVRRLWHHHIWKSRSRGRLTFRTLIVGDNDEGAHLARVMSSTPSGFEAVGFVASGNGGGDRDGLPVVADVGGIHDALEETGAECLFVASSAMRESDMREVVKAARLEGVEVRVSANIPEMLSTRLSAQPLGGVMAFSLWPVRLTGLQAVTKRSFDLIAGSALFLLSLISWIPIVVAVKAGSGGPIVYKQTRVGRRGKEFTLLKFRTMVSGADSLAQRDGVPLFKDRTDPRVTTAGRFLRRWSLDELPQLWNVLKGEMSLVGPRPPLPREVAAYEEWQRDRLEVRPGITGLWQVSGRSELTFEDCVRLDLFYIENWSLAYDLYLLAKTVPAVVGGRGAF